MPMPEGSPASQPNDQPLELQPVTLEQVDRAWADVLNGKLSPTTTPEYAVQHLDDLARMSQRLEGERSFDSTIDDLEIELKEPPTNS